VINYDVIAKTVSEIVERIDILLSKVQRHFAGKTLSDLEREDVLQELSNRVTKDLLSEGYTLSQINDAWIIWRQKKEVLKYARG
jgi:hypothetical protein